MNNRELQWFLLNNTKNFGAKSIHYIYSILKEKNRSILEVPLMDEKEFYMLFPEIGKGKFSRASFSSLQNSINSEKNFSDYNKLKELGINLIGLDDKRYPANLLEKLKEDAPPLLFCKGYLNLLQNNNISIVGSRDADDFSNKITNKIAKLLSNEGYNIISGYAKGIDTSAHLGALQANGTTSVILSYGFNFLNVKKDFKELNWESNTLFISQFAPYERFSGANAMKRNKLVCSLSQAIIVISSGEEKDSSGRYSGTFDAGKSALQYGIPLFVLNPKKIATTPKGNNDLIGLGGIQFDDEVELFNEIKNLKNDSLNSKENRVVKEKKTEIQLTFL